jgi:hypothetical protein
MRAAFQPGHIKKGAVQKKFILCKNAIYGPWKIRTYDQTVIGSYPVRLQNHAICMTEIIILSWNNTVNLGVKGSILIDDQFRKS